MGSIQTKLYLIHPKIHPNQICSTASAFTSFFMEVYYKTIFITFNNNGLILYFFIVFKGVDHDKYY